MQLATALGLVGTALVGGLMWACYEWGAWATRAYILRLEEKQHHEAMDIMARDPDRGDALRDSL